MMFHRLGKCDRSWLNVFRLTVWDLALIAFLVTYGLVGMRSFDLRMANLHEDDGPILYAYAFKDPSLFEGDFQAGAPLSFRVPFKVITSAMVWIPALLWRYLNVDPYLSTWLITLIQGLSIGLSVYISSLALVRQRAVAVVAVVFAYIAAPWNWNPANYGADSSFNFLPYAANLVIAPVLLAFACLIRGRVVATWLLLAVAGLIHPDLGLCACAIAGVYWLWEGLRSPSSGLWRRLAGLAAVCVITILPSLVVTLTIPGDPLPRAEIMAGLRQNQHIWPWANEYLWPFSVQTTLEWLVLAALSWRWRARFSWQVRLLWVAALVSAVVISLTHVIGAVWQIPLLLNLIGLRSFMWLALIALPLVMYYWGAHIRSGDWLGAVLSLLCLALPLYARQYALFLPLIVGLLLVDVSQGHLSVWSFDLPAWGRRTLRVLAFCVLLAWSVSFLAMPFDLVRTPRFVLEAVSQLTWTGISPVHYNAVGPLPMQSVRVELLVVVALLSLGAWGLDRLRRIILATPSARCYNVLRPTLIGLIVVIYGSRFMWLQWQVAKTQRVSSDIYTLDVQLWAREHTLSSSLFVIPAPGGWRTMSRRPKLSPFTRESYAYIAPRQAKEYRDRLLTFYGISAEEGRELRGYGPYEVYSMEQSRFWGFTEGDFLRFAPEFGATHLVLATYPEYRYTETTQFDLPLAYENPCYVVYSLDAVQFVERMRQQVEAALADVTLDLRDTRVVTEGGATRILARTGQDVLAESGVQVGDGPESKSSAFVIAEQTRLNGPSAALSLREGSLSIWARLTDLGKEYSDLERVNGNNDLYIYRQGTDGKFAALYNGVLLGTTPVAVTDDRWHHYVFTWQNGRQAFYIDSRHVLSAQVPASTAGTKQFAIGWLGDRDGEQWAGFLADLVVFDRALSSGEVAALYQMVSITGE